MAGTLYPGNISPSWQVLIPGSDVNNPKDNIELTANLISQIAKRLDDPSIENIYSLYNSLSHDRTYVNKEVKSTPYFARQALEAKAWEKNGWLAPELPRANDPRRPADGVDDPAYPPGRELLKDKRSMVPDAPGAEKYFGNYAPAPNDGSGAANRLAPFESPPIGASGPIPYLGSTNSAQQLFAKVPPSDFPAFPSWVSQGGAIGPGNPRLPDGSPTLPTPQKRSAVPNGPAWDSAQGATPAASAFQENAAYSPAGDVQALAQRIARMLGGAGRFVGNSLVSPAEAASPSSPLLRGPVAPNAPPIADPPAGAYFPGSNAALGAETDDSAPSVANKDFRYLTRHVADKPQASVFDTGAPAVPFVPDSPELSGGFSSLPVRFLTRVDARNPGQAALPQQAARPLGLVSGEPMPDWPFPPPIFDFPRKSVAASEDSEDRMERLLRSMGIY